MKDEDRKRVVFLLDHWQDLFAPKEHSIGQPGDTDSGVALLSPMSRAPSAIELKRTLELLREKMPCHYRHLAGHYDAPWRTVREPKRYRHKNRWIYLKADPEKPEDWNYRRERLVPRWVMRRMVERGTDIICGLWRLPNGVDIPKDLQDAYFDFVNAA